MYKYVLLLPFFSFFLALNSIQSQTVNDSLQLLLKSADFWRGQEQSPIRLEKTVEVNNAILELDCRTGLLDHLSKSIVFFRLSNYFFEIGNGEQALYYAEGGLEYAKKHYGMVSVKNIPYLNHLAQTLEVLFDNNEATLQIRKEIEQTRQHNNVDSLSTDEKARIFENLIFIANSYLKTEDETKFDSTYAQIDQLVKTKTYEDAFNAFEYALFKSHGYLALNKVEKAYQIIYAEATKQDSLFKIDSKNVIELIFAQLVLSEVYLAQNKPHEALALYRRNVELQTRYIKDILMYEVYITHVGAQALTTLEQYPESRNILINTLEKLEKVGNESSSTYLTELYEQLAKNQYLASLESSNKDLLYESYTYSQKSLGYLKTAWKQLKNQNDLKYSLNEYYQVFETSLQTLHALYNETDSLHYFEEALRLIELTKNVELRSSIKHEEIAKELGVSSHLIERERRFKEQLFDLEYELDHSSEASLQTSLQDSIHQLNAELIALQESIHRQYPNYTGRIHTQKGFTWEALGQHLEKEDQTLLYFSSGEENLFLLAASPNGYVFHKSPISRDSLQTWVNEIREDTYASPNQMDKGGLDKFKILSKQLFDITLAPIGPIHTSRLLIIPDGPLEILPFSLLLSETPGPNTLINQWSFALKEYSFSHAYALDLLLNPSSKTEHSFKEKILAFAPDFPTSLLRSDETRSQGQLNNNQDEVIHIKDQFSTTAFLGNEARLSTFRTTASDYAVLHLATHAVANTEFGGYSYLAFSEIDPYDNQLNVGELYTMNIPAELVVLSACETGLGEWQQGEGVIGLERAFSYAGAQSLVTTHWKVSDKASANLMGYFYDKLAEGLPKDQALQQAQITFIEEQDNWLAHPFFWAAYVQKGDTAPLNIPGKTPKWLWFLLGIGGIGGIFAFSRKTA